jgi:hypothetical protein
MTKNLTLLKTLDSGRDRVVEAKSGKGGNMENMIRRINEAAGAPKSSDTDSVADEDKAIDTPPAKAVESADSEPAAPVEPVPVSESKVFTVPESLVTGLVERAKIEARAEERQNIAPLEQSIIQLKADLEREREQKEEAQAKAADILKFQERFGLMPSTASGNDGTSKAPAFEQAPAILRSGDHISGPDALREYRAIRASSPLKEAKNEAGNIVEQRDSRFSDEWLANHRESVMEGLERKYQEAGRSGGKEAVTARADIQGIIMETVSDMVRTNHHPNHIWKNVLDYTVDIGRDSGNGINIPRYAFAEGSIDGADWDLSNVAALTTDAQPIQASTVKVLVQEYGMGKPGLPTNRNKPIGVNLFLNAVSVRDIMNVVSNNLGYNYAQFETAVILYGLINSTGVTYYNKKGEPTTTPASLAAGDGGQCDWDFLTGLSAEMSTQGVPAYANGKYFLALAPKDLATLEISLRANMQFLNRASLSDLTSVFKQSANNSDINYSGYKGDIGDFMIFDTSTLSQGPFAAALPGNTENIAGSPRAMRTGFAMGAHAMGRGVAAAFNIRESDATDFQRQRILAWNSYEGFAALDLSASLSPPGTPVPQQTRVFKLRFTSTAI